MDAREWPLPPIRPEDLPLIRGLLSPEDYRKLLQPDAASTSPQPEKLRYIGGPLPCYGSRMIRHGALRLRS